MMKYECAAYYTTTNVPTPYPKYNCKSPNVRTVLFKRSSISKQCWNADEVSLLLSRAIIQNILPRKIPQNMPLLLDYFKMCLKMIKKEVKNFHARKIIATVMIDTIGGYLQSYGLPVIKRMYYEGNLDFDTVNEFFTLQNNFKRILATDGGGWSRPMVIKQKITKVFPLKIPKNLEGDSCKDLITIYDCNVSRTAYINDPISFNQSIIPMPQLDDEKTPQAIGVPLRGRYLYDLQSKEAYDVLLIYYTMSIECLYDLKNKIKLNNCNKTQDYENYFDYYFFNWIMKYVMPRLHDETWYPGFSSVLRILATIKQNGIPINNPKTFIILKHVNKIKSAMKNNNETLELRFHHTITSQLLWTSVFLLFMLVILLVVWIFVVLKHRQVKEEEEKQTEPSLSDTSYESISTSTSAKDTSTSSGNTYIEIQARP